MSSIAAMFSATILERVACLRKTQHCWRRDGRQSSCANNSCQEPSWNRQKMTERRCRLRRCWQTRAYDISTPGRLAFCVTKYIVKPKIWQTRDEQALLWKWASRVTLRRVELCWVIGGNVRKLQDKCSVGMHNEVIWIVKDGQRVQVGAWVYGHHDKLLKFLSQFLTVIMSNATIVDIHYKDQHSHRMTTRFLDALREIHVERNYQWWANLGHEFTCDVRRTGISPKPSTRARPKTSQRRKWHWRETCTSWCELLHREAVPQSLS